MKKMKTIIIILGILGAFSAGGLGVKWMNDFGAMSEQQRMTIQMTGQGDKLEKMATAAFILMAGFFAGLAGAYLAAKGKYTLGGGLMLGAAIFPVFFAPLSLISTFPLLAGGIVALVAQSKEKEGLSVR